MFLWFFLFGMFLVFEGNFIEFIRFVLLVVWGVFVFVVFCLSLIVYVGMYFLL